MPPRGVTLAPLWRYRCRVSTRRRFSGPLERLVTGAVTAAGTTAAKDLAAATIDPETLVKALNFALLGSGSHVFLWRSAEDCVVVSDTYSADASCRFSEVLHLNSADGSCHIDIRQYQLKYTNRIEDCVEVEL
jgi:hypothetical protein